MLWCLSVVKNIESALPVFSEFIQILLQELPDSVKFWVYENNSTDGTKEGLLNLKRSLGDKFFLVSETLTAEELLRQGRACSKDNTPCRMELIASARNQLMNKIESLLKDDDIVLWIDPDMPRVPIKETLVHWIRNFPEWADALFANGLSVNGKYFDSYAYRDREYPFGYELLREDQGNWIGQKGSAVQVQHQMNEPMIPVYSAFGGLALYRARAIRDCRYSGTPTEDYTWLIEKIQKESPQNSHVRLMETTPETHIEGRLQGVYLYNQWYWNSSGYNFPVLCEHVTFHSSMIRRGFDRLFVCPSLVYFSDHFA